MKLAWHIFQKDFRRLRWALLGWTGLYVLQFCLYQPFGSSTDNPWGPDRWAWGAQLVAGWILVAQLIHADPLLDANATWRTRPISGARLMAGKLLGLATMFWLWPAILTLPWWLSWGYGFTETLRMLAAQIVGMAMFTTVAAAVATLTRTLLQFIAWSIVVGFAIGLGAFTLAVELPTAAETAGRVPLLITRAALGQGIVIGAAVLVLLLQFLTPRHRLAFGVGGVSFALAGLVVVAWSWTTAEMLAKLWPRFALPTATGRLTSGSFFLPAAGERRATVQANFDFSSSGIAGSEEFEWKHFEGVLHHGETGRLPVDVRMLETRRFESDAAPVLARFLAGTSQVRATRRSGSSAKLVAPAALRPALQGTPGARLSGTATAGLWRASEWARVPVRRGEGGGRGLRNVHISDVSETPANGGVLDYLEVLETEPTYTAAEILRELSRFAGERRERWSENELVIHGDGPPRFFNREDGSRITPLRIGMLVIRMGRYGNEVASADRQTDQVTRLRNARLSMITSREIAALHAPISQPLAVDLIALADRDTALQQAQAESKLVLLLTRFGDVQPVEKGDFSGWWDDSVRQMLRDRFVVADVFDRTRNAFDNSYPSATVLGPDGSVRDVFRAPARAADWALALTANINGATYSTVLRNALTTAPNDLYLRNRLIDTLVRRGEMHEAVDHLLVLIDRRAAELREQNRFVFSWDDWRLDSLTGQAPSVRLILRERRLEAVARLQREPMNLAAAWRLALLSAALRDHGVWNEFPRVLPAANPMYWELVPSWLRQSAMRRIPLDLDAVAWDTFSHPGMLGGMPNRADSGTVAHLRSLLLGAGIEGVTHLVATNENQRAYRLALEVLKLDSSVATRNAFAKLLAGRVTDEELRVIRSVNQ